MDLTEALSRLNNAALCVTLAFCLLCLYLLIEFIEWSSKATPPPGHWCRQHAKPRHECRDEHRE